MQSGLKGITAPVGVGNFRYRPPGRGARSRTTQDKLRDVVSIKDYKAITVNDTGAFLAALDALTGSGALYIPAGRYVLDSGKISKTLLPGQSIKIYGDGTDATTLHFPNAGDGLTFNYVSNTFAWIDGNSMIFEDIGFTTNQSGGGGSAITINGASTIGNGNRPTIFNRCGFRGTLVNNSYWTIGIEIRDTQNVEVNDSYYFSYVLALVGTAILFTGSTDPIHPTVLNVHNFQQQFGEIGIHMTGFVEGLNVIQSNFTQLNYGILVDTDGSIPMFSSTGSQFNCAEACIWITDGDACQIVSNLFFQSDGGSAGKPAVILSGSQYSTIVGNTFIGLSGIPTAIILQSGSTDNIIGGNVFKSFATNIWLQSGANNNEVASNRHADGTPVLDQGTGNIWFTETSVAFSPRVSDGQALGTTVLPWSDLHLASGALVNFNNGDLTLTHANGSNGFLAINKPFKLKTYTVATLPAAATVGAGATALVTDANATAFASVVAGGGANVVPVYSNGAGWLIG